MQFTVEQLHAELEERYVSHPPILSSLGEIPPTLPQAFARIMALQERVTELEGYLAALGNMIQGHAEYTERFRPPGMEE